MDQDLPDPVARFATYVATLGRGPGRSRALTRDEAADALALILGSRVDPAQIGAFLMLLRYRGEDPDEIAGLVEAARGVIPHNEGGSAIGPVSLDWPSYGAGRTRGAPWFLLSALALAQSGERILMHGTNEFGGGMPVDAGLTALGLDAARDAGAVARSLDRIGFAYWPAASMAPSIDRLLGMRSLFGLRSPINTVARLLDPGNAGVSVDGVFHPPYIALHLAVAERLRRKTLVVVKGGGGEAERTPLKPVAAHLWNAGETRELLLPEAPILEPVAEPIGAEGFAALWRGSAGLGSRAEQTVIGTIALALIPLHPELDAQAADARATSVWCNRRPAG